MSHRKIKSGKTIFSILEKDSKTTLRNLNKFYEVLVNLRFEGKQNVAKNMIRLRGLVSYFQEEVKAHMREEEKVLFPFLRTHIPRLEPMICLLVSEHGDFRNSLKDLNLSLSVFKKVNSDKTRIIHQFNEQGIHLICLLRGHMSVETKTLYRAADNELRPDEKKRLIDQIKKNTSSRRK